MTDRSDYRLPRSARPRHYQLELTPDLVASRFEGEEVVTFDVDEPIESLVCNAAELEIHEARLETPDGAGLDGRVELDEAAQRVTMGFGSTLSPGSGYRLHVRFTGSAQRPAARFLPQHLH